MEFEVGNRTRRPADRLARHANNKTQQRLGPGIIPENLVPLWLEPRARDFDQPSVIRSTIHSETPQPGAFQRRLSDLFVFDSLVFPREAANCWMIFQLHS